jgi:curved DNA-binding protein CbpA
MTKNHYDTLGVRRDASLETIKAEFRKWSKQLHPDVGGATACADRFKEISIAAHTLTNEKRKRTYDYHLRESGPMGRGLHRSSHHSGFAHPTGTTSRPGPGVAFTPFQIFVSNIMRPRSFALGLAAMCIGAYAFSFIGGDKHKDGRLRPDGSELVKAWKNPETGLYEQPAPWDPAYRSLNPRLEDIPRELVVRRKR